MVLAFLLILARVELVIAAADDDFRPLERTIREAIAGRDVELVSTRKDRITPADVLGATVAPAGVGEPTVARVLLDLGTQHEATIYLVDNLRRRVHVRRLPLDNGFDGVARESVLFVVERSLDEILAGREIGVTWDEYQRSVEPAAAPAAAPMPPVTQPRRVSLAAGYEASAMGTGVYPHGPRVTLGVRFARVRLGGALRLQVPVTAGDDTATARLTTAGGALSIAATLFSRRDLFVAGGAGVGLDATRIAPTASSPDLQPAPPFWAGSFNLRGFTEIEQIIGRLSLSAVIGLEIYPLAERYTVAAAGGVRTVFAPHRLRPVAALMVGVLF